MPIPTENLFKYRGAPRVSYRNLRILAGDILRISSEMRRIRTVYNKGRADGYREGYVSAQQIKHYLNNKKIDRYLSVVINIKDFIVDTLHTYQKKISLIDIRADLRPLTKIMRFLILFKMKSTDGEKWLSWLLPMLSRAVWEKDNFVADFLYINAYGKQLDYKSIDADFPISLIKE